ncbi:MAG: NAD(P)-binding domain-containing protein, partial [Pararhizobium sp.]
MANPPLKPHYSAVVIGGGQAGLSASHYLKVHGIDHVVFEKKTVAHKWKNERWDAFCLVTPNWQCQLPDHPYDGTDPNGFMVKGEILAYVDRFVAKVDAPVLQETVVTALERHGELFRIETSAGTVTANAVVIATSLYSEPAIPRAAERLPEGILQIHTAHYRNPGQLPEGGVIVVGSGQSGCQIAEDLHLAGRKVHLVTGNAPRCARFYRGRDVVDWLSDIGQYDITVEHDGMTKKKHDTNHYLTGRDGGRDIDLRKFA